MEYFVYDAGTLVDIVKLNANQIDLFISKNPSFILEPCEDTHIWEEDYEEEDF